MLKKDETRLIRAGQLPKEAQGAACKWCRCFNNGDSASVESRSAAGVRLV
jgi:hypothetical protein